MFGNFIYVLLRCKQTLELLVILHLAIFFIIYQQLLLTRHVIPWAGRESYWSNEYLAT